MKRSFAWMKMVISAGLMLGLAGCFMGPTGYHKGDLFGGYGDSVEGTGAFEVHFIAQKRSFDFAKDAALYRAAEVTYQNDYRYFVVKSVGDYSTSGVSPNGGGPGQATESDIPQISLHIQCYTQRPAAACYDAYQFLNKVNVPGTDALYTTDQRAADRAAGKTP